MRIALWRRASPRSALTRPPFHTQAPLVGNPAPEFTATAVFDQEFVDIKLSQYKVRGEE
jgi:hypothetical protein